MGYLDKISMSVIDFVICYLVTICVIWTIFIVINYTFWFIPIFMYFSKSSLENSIKNYVTK